MELNSYLESITADTDALAQVAAASPQRPIPACPGWDVAELSRHLISTHRWVTAIVRSDGVGRQPHPDTQSIAEHELADTLRSGAAQLVAALEDAGADKPVWTMGQPRTTRFWFRRQAIETAVHRWDAQDASDGVAAPIDAELAADGVAELLETLLAGLHRHGGVPGTGQTFHVHRTDGPGEWFVRFDEAEVSVTREHAKGDVALRGPASDLLLALWRRRPLTSLDVIGDPEVLDQWPQLVPAI